MFNWRGNEARRKKRSTLDVVASGLTLGRAVVLLRSEEVSGTLRTVEQRRRGKKEEHLSVRSSKNLDTPRDIVLHREERERERVGKSRLKSPVPRNLYFRPFEPGRGLDPIQRSAKVLCNRSGDRGTWLSSGCASVSRYVDGRAKGVPPPSITVYNNVCSAPVPRCFLNKSNYRTFISVR